MRECFREAEAITNVEQTQSPLFDLAIVLLPPIRRIAVYMAEQEYERTFDLPPPKELALRIDEFAEEIDAIAKTPIATDLMHQLRWRLHGRRVYELHPSLMADFLSTDFSRLKGSDIPAPLPSFYVHLPEAEKFGFVRKGCVLDGFYACVRKHPLETFFDLFAVFVDTEEIDDEEDRRELLFAFPVRFSQDVEESIEKLSDDPQDKADMEALTRLFVGLCFYLSCEDRDVERQSFGPSPEVKARAKKLGGKAGKRLLEISSIPVHYLRVGHRMARTSAELENLAGADASVDAETRKLLRRHVVRGHFRQQPCGPGRTERKTIFIRSFWKGPPWSEAVGAIHKLRGDL
jgi:hypothetical protein